MCVYSTVSDYWQKDFERKYPSVYEWVEQSRTPLDSVVRPTPSKEDRSIPATKEDIQNLRKEIESLKKLLKAASTFDEETDQAHCETEEKVALIKKVAELVGVDLSDLE